MEKYSAGNDWARRVQPLERLNTRSKLWNRDLLASLNSIAVINKLLGNLDKGRRIPILLRHYLALNGRFVSFCINKEFNDSLGRPDHCGSAQRPATVSQPLHGPGRQSRFPCTMD